MPHDRRPAGPRVRLALVGFGYWGPNYARVLNELPDAQLTVICDQSRERLALVRQRYRTIDTCESVDDLLARDDVDGVVIATPAATHEALVRATLSAGRHVLVEKPMALRAEGCETLCDLAEQTGRVLMVGYTFLYNAGVRKMKDMMTPEQFGQPYYLHATRTNLGPIRPDVNAVWDLWAKEAGKPVWRLVAEMSPEEIVRRWLDHGPKLILVTQGSKGAVAYSREHRVSIQPQKVTVVDTVGAGDTFNAGVLASLHDQGLLTKAAIATLSEDAIRHALAISRNLLANVHQSHKYQM